MDFPSQFGHFGAIALQLAPKYYPNKLGDLFSHWNSLERYKTLYLT